MWSKNDGGAMERAKRASAFQNKPSIPTPDNILVPLEYR
jgi:hypothetical protein